MRRDGGKAGRYRAIVFDLWYTLVCPEDFRPPGERNITAILEALNLDPDPFVAYWQGNQSERSRTPRLMVEYIQEYLGSMGRTISERELAAFDGVWKYHDQALATPRPDVLDALKGLGADGFRLGLLSNTHEREIRAWSSSPLTEYFDQACFSFQFGWMKPEPAAYAQILESLGVPASEAVFVGDGESGELEGARAAGFAKTIFMRGILAQYGLWEDKLTTRATQADVVVDQISELSRVVGAR